jgi:Ala-tRNA(Pro) deacylase
MEADADALCAYLDEHDISYERTDHPPVMTCEEAARLVPPLSGAKTKNLFLRDAKGRRHFLVVLPAEKEADLKGLGAALDAGKLSFASPRRLEKHLGIAPGAVSPLALVNDADGAVTLAMDRSVAEAGALQAHPLVNTSTLVLSRDAFGRFLDATAHRPVLLASREE